MSRIRSTDTQPEIMLRKSLYKSGFRYRVRFRLTGRPDIAFPKRKIALFVHGCFWHMHGCKNSVTPKTNRQFWIKKLSENKIRDGKVVSVLRGQGWKVKIIRECDLEKNFDRTVNDVIDFFIYFSPPL